MKEIKINHYTQITRLKINKWYYFEGKKEKENSWMMRIEKRGIIKDKATLTDQLLRKGESIFLELTTIPLFDFKGEIGNPPLKKGITEKVTIRINDLRIEDFRIYEMTEKELEQKNLEITIWQI